MYGEIINRWKRANPLSCHYLGIHDYDGQLPDMSEKSIKKRCIEIREDLIILKTMTKSISKFEQFEFGLVKSKLEEELFELEVRQEFRDNPVVSVFPLAVIEMSYTTRSFASVEDRVKSIVNIEKAIPLFIDQADALLNNSLHAPKVMMAIQFLGGIISYYKDLLITFITKIDDEDLINDWSEYNIKAVKSMETYLNKLQTKYLPTAHHNFALGSAKFAELLEKTEGVKIDLDKLLKIGENDLEKNYQSMLILADELTGGDLDKFMDVVKSDIPTPETLIKDANSTLHRTRQFLIDNNIVSIPTDEQVKIVHTPEFARSFAFAAMSIPGPFEIDEASEAYYWITPPDPNWPESRQVKFLEFFNKPFLEVVTIHEVWPGHYLQLLYDKKAKSDIVKMFSRSTAMIEGWGHYTEEMMFEEGYEPFDRKLLHAGQLLGALQRNVRFISAIKMHCKGMTVQESKELFIKKAFLGEDNAIIESNRGTIDPMYLNYTLGKLMIKKLRNDYKKEKGDNFNLKEFHDKLLSFGSPPITVLRKLILENQEGANI